MSDAGGDILQDEYGFVMEHNRMLGGVRFRQDP